jgi:HEAT repeat protein
VADLFNKRLQYKLAIPILLKWLPRVERTDLKEAIVRALSVKWARPAAAVPLIGEFRKSTDPSWSGLRWAIGNALSVVADDSVFDDVVQLLQAKAYGRAREMLPLALAQMKNPAAVDVLIESLSDQHLAPRAIQALGKLRAKKAKAALKPFTERAEPWIRKEALKALARINES